MANRLRSVVASTIRGIKKGGKKLLAVGSALTAAVIANATPSHAAPTTFTELDTVTTTLTDGIGAIKTNGITIITAVIIVFIVVFGISWLISVTRKKMSKAS